MCPPFFRVSLKAEMQFPEGSNPSRSATSYLRDWERDALTPIPPPPVISESEKPLEPRIVGACHSNKFNSRSSILCADQGIFILTWIVSTPRGIRNTAFYNIAIQLKMLSNNASETQSRGTTCGTKEQGTCLVNDTRRPSRQEKRNTMLFSLAGLTEFNSY